MSDTKERTWQSRAESAEARAQALEQRAVIAEDALLDFIALLGVSDDQYFAMRDALVLAGEALEQGRDVVRRQVENERYCEREAIKAGHYTPDPANTHQSAAVNAVEAISSALSAIAQVKP